ncbi:methylated-DNA--[protein]-cysteine S-methyltransferase [Variovorax sp. ZT4R33]|uniref:methylated-DNA--[protein]-cysteine S-methyltransferase n=1 Tax=Variovorax sp. ZT4R33 TaxID=3443743 RepID=UPI003F4740EC
MSASAGFALFATAIGPCAIAWGAKGIVGAQLPETDEATTRARMAARFPHLDEAAPPRAVQATMAAMAAVLDGTSKDLLLDAVLDEDAVPAFHRRVYALARRIPPGETRTYGELAEALGSKGLSRAVGQALGRNPFAPIVPCHRILAADGRPGGFSAHGGALAKLRMLALEGAWPGGTRPLFDER